MDSQLLDFTKKALAAGSKRPEIAAALRRAGWAEPDVNAALGAFAEVDFPLPVPRPKPYLSAREVFVYLVLFAALYAAAYNLGALIFQLIDHRFPDLARAGYLRDFSPARMRWNISAMIVAFPLFFVTFRRVTRSIAKDPTKRNSRPRKWLTYLTLFVTGLWLAGDGMALIYNALGGELTIRFLLKAAVVALIAGSIFSFFLADMRQEERT